jgi:fructoselysine 6-kinase
MPEAWRRKRFCNPNLHGSLVKAVIIDLGIRAAAIGDNCIDLYPRLGRQYCSGNAVDFAVNLKKLGIPTAIISTTGNDANGQLMLHKLTMQGLDLSHFHGVEGPTAITYMDITEMKDRVHGKYVEGVLEKINFSQDDLDFAAGHTLVHSAFWGKADQHLQQLRSKGALISFDYANKFEEPLVERTLKHVDYAFFSFPEGREKAEIFLKGIHACGPKIAVTTFGAKGSLAYDGSTYFDFGIFPARVENTVGAGDAFIAGFIYGVLKHYDVKKCLETGARLAAQVVEVFEPWANY